MIKSWVAGFKKPSKETRYGDSQVFIDTKNNICLIIDGGLGQCSKRLISYLKQNKIKEVYLLLTHPHNDHGDGLLDIIKDSYFTVMRFYCYDPNSLKKGLSNNEGSDSVRDDIDYLNDIISEAKKRKIEVEYLVHGDKVELGDIKFNVYREQPSYVADSDKYGWAYVNDGSLCLYFPDLYYWTSGDGSDSIWNFIKKLGLKVKFFKIPHHGNNCPKSQANGLKSGGADICWYNDLEPNGVGTNDFTLYGARRCKEAGITVIDCIGSDIEITFAMKRATIMKGGSIWTYEIPYSGEYQEGWVKYPKGWCYRYKNGSWAIGWKTIFWKGSIRVFYFDEHGYMVTGWHYLKWEKGYSWFFFDKTNGDMKTGWIYNNNFWYYLNPTDGHMQTGWLDYKNKKCYLEPASDKNQGHAYRSVTVMIDGETWRFDDNCYGEKVTASAFVKRTVIDISQFNNVTNWSAVKAIGYPVIIRIGYRGSKTGAITYDPKYKEYRSACEQYGIEHYFYFFPCSITDAEAHEEALFIKNEVMKSGVQLVYLDSEVVQSDKSGRSDKLSKETRTRMLRIICEDLLSWGISCGIYASRSWLYNNLDMSNIPSNAVKNTWVAEYGVDKTKYTGTYIMWQYTSKGSVNGISGNVDLSHQYEPFYLIVNNNSPQTNGINTEPKKEITKSELEKVIEVAKAELGYLEKQYKYRNNDEVLYHKTKGAGSDNVVKYWKETKPEWQGSYWCFTKGTMVLTDKGYKPIEEIRIGDKVVNAYGTTFNTVIETKNHEEDTYNVRVYGTLPFNVTGSHPFLSAKRLDNKRKKEFSELSFRPIEELEIKDVISSPRISIEKEVGLDYDDLWSLGFYVGDGWKTNKGEYRICGGVEKEPLIEAHFKNLYKEKTYKSRTCQEYRIKKQNNELLISYLDECGTGAINKKVPRSILFGTKKDKIAFLDGYFAADGSKRGSVWTISKQLVLGIAKLCTDIGYGVSVREEHRQPIGKIWDKRRNAYREFNQQEIIYVATINKNSSPQHQLYICEDNDILLPIKKIDNIKEEKIVYNISTDGDHTYLANNLAVHNCADFVTWVFQTALGKQRAKELLKHYPYVYCPTLAGLFTKYSTPQVGDIVIFWKNGEYAHTGLVIAVNGNRFTTIEGNTSGASTVVPNGGGVCQKTYNLSNVNAKFCRPAYSSTAITSDTNKVVVADDMHTVKWKGYVNVGKNTKLTVRLQPNASAKECSFSGLKQGTEVSVSYEQGDWYLIKYDGKFGYVQSQYIGKTKVSEISNPDPVTDDIHTVKWTGIVNTNGGTLNVRIQPTTSAKTCSFSPLRKGTEVGVCSQSGDWYLIKYNGKYGYAYSSYIKRK